MWQHPTGSLVSYSSISSQLGCGGQVVHLVQGAGEAVEQRHGISVAAGFP